MISALQEEGFRKQLGDIRAKDDARNVDVPKLQQARLLAFPFPPSSGAAASTLLQTLHVHAHALQS